MDHKLNNIIDKHLELLADNKFEECNKILKRTRIKTTKTEELLTHMQATVAFKDELPYYNTLYTESVKHMKRRKEFTEALIEGL